MNILTDPTPERLARMIHVGQVACFPKVKFISNRMKIEKVIEDARRNTRPDPNALPTPSLEKSQLRSMLSSDDLESLLAEARQNGGQVAPPLLLTPPTSTGASIASQHHGPDSPSLSKRFSGWFGSRRPSAPQSPARSESVRPSLRDQLGREDSGSRRASVMAELERQMRVFSDDTESDGEVDDGEPSHSDNGHDGREAWREYSGSEAETESEVDEARAVDHVTEAIDEKYLSHKGTLVD